MKGIVCFALLLLFSCCHAQEEQVFSVKKKTGIQISPDIDTLVAGVPVTFTVSGIDLKTISPLFIGGTVDIKGDDLIITGKTNSVSGAKYTLVLRTIEKGRFKSLYQHNFIIASNQVPLFTYAFTTPPIVTGFYWNSKYLKNGDTLSKSIISSKAPIRLRTDVGIIDSFKMTFTINGSLKTYSCIGVLINGEMLSALRNIKAGERFAITEISYASQPAPQTAGPFELYVTALIPKLEADGSDKFW